MRFSLIVFDLDGTLVDSRRDLAESVNALVVERGGVSLPEERVGRMVGDGAAILIARVFEAAGLALTPDALPRFLALYDSRLLKHTRPYSGMIETLAALQSRASLAVLTNKPLGATREILAGLDLARYFPADRVLGGDGLFPRKPDPAGLRHLVTGVGAVPDQTLMVGDSIIDWRTAHAAGTIGCVARWGFGFEGFPEAELACCDHLIDSPAELLTLVDG